jgi:hypothetical protein
MGMNIRVELCHVDTLRCVVRVEAWNDSQLIGSSLGEAATAEEAEDRAWQRLSRRLEIKKPEAQEHEPPAKAAAAISRSSTPELIRKETPNPQQSSPTLLPEQPTTPLTSPSATGSVDQPVEGDVRAVTETPSESPTDPDDWSEELTAIDFELKRIGWTREQERQYLERAFGHGSRHRLTRYADLVAFLRQLRQIQPGDTPDQSPVPIRRSDLITQGDQMLSTLGWTGEQARSFLQHNLNSISRQQLSDEQLLQFNMLLEEQTLKN